MSEWIVWIGVDTENELDERTLVALADAAERRNASVSNRVVVGSGIGVAAHQAAHRDGSGPG